MPDGVEDLPPRFRVIDNLSRTLELLSKLEAQLEIIKEQVPDRDAEKVPSDRVECIMSTITGINARLETISSIISNL